MIKVYFKQAWQLLKQNKLYSTVYIIGTGLAIAMTMTIAIIYYIKIAPVYPEMNRNRTMIAKSLKLEYPEKGGMSSSGYSYPFVKEHLYTLTTAEAVSATPSLWGEFPVVELSDNKGILPVSVKYVDDKFWKVFTFTFISGKPFTEADFQSGIRTAVISSSIANTLFGTNDATGKYFTLNGNEYHVSGVVKDVSFATPETYSQIWIPFTVKPEILIAPSWGKSLLGQFKVYILAPSTAAMDDVYKEVNNIVQVINSNENEYVISTVSQPEAYWKSNFRKYSNMEIDWGEVFKTFGIVLLALLIIPAVNLAGMVSSRMEKRLPEMGVRKTFGASKGKLLNQILIENFLLTVLGGIAGLVISYIIMYTSKSWILTLFDAFPQMGSESDTFFTLGMLFNPVVFVIAFAICFVLNFLSAIIPAYYGLRKDIVKSLSNNR